MRLLKSIILSIIIVFTLFNNSYSQGSLDIHVGTAIPLSEMSSGGISLNSDNTVYGTAVAGVNMGLRYNYQFTESGFGAFAGIDFLYNGINKEYKEDMEEHFSLFGIDDYKFYAYYNIPLSLGGSYRYSMNENLAFSCIAGATVNFFKVSDFVIGDQTLQTDRSHNIGFMIGAGIIYKERISFQINYLGLGKHEYTVTDKNKPEYSSVGEMRIDMLTLTIGFSF